ncbi:MAG: imidazoleglycerol-phosphate dehydratase [Candidatus Omnitrophica bacterium]|nr:imidazoleglycerol-phosphate dehydratase [Candidatus Omnitrophota bacterium]MBU1128651.1 imidazoleglycerol-phosphate dehydratase [Candidatus Omnitrophota bacterium]MBU1783936.1 imidazoleglycerol-phosphate dehydratase [Candidatus Omnitrophota bacterium]MBU1852219.1 imidazoleglycerol-phosphate dehydratase [Candidatus Omnitrophota bacterium]
MGLFRKIFGKTKSATAKRKTSYTRKSKETEISIPLLNIDGTGETDIVTSIGFLDHMLTLFAYHGYFDLKLKATGDTHVDNHHLNEDVGIAMGEAFKQALGDEKGVVRMASVEIPMDNAGAKVTIDLSNRFAFRFVDKRDGSSEDIRDEEGYSIHYAKDFLESFAKKLCMNLHVEVLGTRDADMHHYLEAVFKTLGIALDKATRIDPRRAGEVPSSKGIL